MREVEKLLKVVRGYSPSASLSTSKDGMGVATSRIDVRCSVFGQAVNLQIFIEPSDFSIRLGDLLTVDKIEDDEVLTDDISEFVADLLGAVKEQRAAVAEYALFGRKAYALNVTGSTLTGPRVHGHAHYETFTEAIIKKFGKRARSGRITFRES